MGNTVRQRIGHFILHLPGIQLFYHLRYQYAVLVTDKFVKTLEAKAIKAQAEGREKRAKKLTLEKDKWELEVHGFQSKLNSFKGREALTESFPQTVLQLTIQVKDGIDKLKTLGPIGTSAIVTSISTLLLSLSGLTVSLPFFIHGKRRVQFKNFSHLYMKILPLTAIAVLPPILVLVMIFSAIFIMNAWFAVTIFAPLMLAYFISYWGILYFYVRPKIIEENGANHQQDTTTR